MKIGLKGVLGIVLSAALLFFAFRDVHFAEVARELRAADPWLFAGATVAGTLIFVLRARRWRTILEPVAPDLPLGMLWRATAIGAMVNNVVPARAGELARAFALTRETPRVTFAGGIASLAVDRLFDAIVLLLLMLVAMLDPAIASAAPGSRALVTGAAITGVVGMAAVMTLLYLVVFFPARVIALFELFARRVAPRVEERGRAMLVAFADGLAVLRHPGRFAAVFAWTLAHWLLQAFAFWLAFRAVGIEAPLTAALLVQGVIAIGVALPSAPGFFGPFEVAAVASLALYGVPRDLAVSWALGYHLLTYVPITLIGIVHFARLGLKIGDIGRASRDEPPRDGPARQARPAETGA